jgi:hypothetical protein
LSKRRKKSNGKETTIKVFLFLVAVGILPFTVSLFIHLPDLFSDYEHVTREMWLGLAGFFFFFILFFIFGPPVRSYIVEHELSHILFALLSGVRIKKVVIGKSDGYVKTEKVNLLIALAPYSLPLYTLCIFIVFKLIMLVNRSALVSLVFYFILGTTMAFHIITTIHYLQLDQPDLKRYGYFTSLVFIFTWSLVVLSLILALLYTRVELLYYLQVSAMHAMDFYRGVGSLISNFFA